MAELMSQEGKGTEVQFTDEQLMEALNKGASLQAQEVAEDGIQADYITLAKPASKALKPKNEMYIEGLKIDDFYVAKKGLNLGAELKVVPLAFITVYNEKSGSGLDAKFLGVWNKEQATTFPLVNGSYYDRQLPNGNILSPSCWVLVEVFGHPELANAIITYKSTGSRIFKQWKDDAKKRSGTSATLVYKVHSIDCSNDKNEWTDIGFEYDGNLLELDKGMAFKCVTKSNEIRDSYQKHTFIANRTIEAPSEEVRAIEATMIEDSNDSDELGF